MASELPAILARGNVGQRAGVGRQFSILPSQP